MQRGYKVPRQFTVAMKLLVPTSQMVKGTRVDTFSDPEESRTFFGSFRTYGGSENLSNEVLTIFDTAVIDTWYNPDIKQDCRILILETGKEYNIISVPENIDMRHKYMQFKVQRVGGRP